MLQNCDQLSKYLHIIKCSQRPLQDMFQCVLFVSKTETINFNLHSVNNSMSIRKQQMQDSFAV